MAKQPPSKLQLAIVFSVLLCEPISFTSIVPVLPQAVVKLGTAKHDEDVGYYVGLVESAFFVAEAAFIIFWARLSDRVGRKPIMITGGLGSIVSIVCFGFSTSFPAILLSRACLGVTNGNVSVLKSASSEMTDESTRLQAMALITVGRLLGNTIGPCVGGSFDHLFGNTRIAERFPFLPSCLAASLFPIFSTTTVFMFFKETRWQNNPKKGESVSLRDAAADEDSPSQFLLPHEDILDAEAGNTRACDRPLSLRELYSIRAVWTSVLGYLLLSLSEIASVAVFPLFLFTPKHEGGLGLDSLHIAIVLAFLGCAGAPWLQRRLQLVRTFRHGCAFFIVFAVGLPLAASAAKSGFMFFAYISIGVTICCVAIGAVAFPAIVTMINNACPSEASLGLLNGSVQSMASTCRAIGPFLSTSIFAVSLNKQLLSGNLVYVVLFGLSAAPWVSSWLLE